jgi:hypothetical protein
MTRATGIEQLPGPHRRVETELFKLFLLFIHQPLVRLALAMRPMSVSAAVTITPA